MAIKEKIKKVFIDTTDLDLANQEIGYLKDLCDSKDKTIAYQKELLNIQGESIKELRKINNEFEKLKEEMYGEKNTRSKHNIRNKKRS